MNWFKTGKWFKQPNKYWEVQLATFDDSTYDISFKRTKNCDHAGTTFTIEIHKLYFCAQVYDSRHWDEENNKFCE